MIRSFLIPVVLCCPCISALAGEVIFKDPYTATDKVPERRALRGDWKIADGIAVCTQDDGLYKKYKDHGPIIFYDQATGDCTVRFQFKPESCKSFVFTMNSEEGHVFRFVSSERGTSFRAYPPDSEVKSIETARGKEWFLKDNEWTPVEVVVKGEKVSVTFGDHEPIVAEHPTYATARSNVSVGFAFGTWSVKDFEITK